MKKKTNILNEIFFILLMIIIFSSFLINDFFSTLMNNHGGDLFVCILIFSIIILIEMIIELKTEREKLEREKRFTIFYKKEMNKINKMEDTDLRNKREKRLNLLKEKINPSYY